MTSNCDHTRQPDDKLRESAMALIGTLGERTAVAIAAKCQVRFTENVGDDEAGRFAAAIIAIIGIKRFHDLDDL